MDGLPGTILAFPHDNAKSKEEFQEVVKGSILKKVKDIILGMKRDNVTKWVDPDFGPTEEDEEKGAQAMYRGGKRPGPQYPAPSSIRWARPQYEGDNDIAGTGSDEEEGGDDGDEYDDEYGDDEFGGGASDSPPLCTAGRLWIGGAGAADVIQGKLGDCWLLGALATLSTRNDLLTEVFWDPRPHASPTSTRDTDAAYRALAGPHGPAGSWGERFKEFGIFICRFMKDFVWHYVIIDDRIPVFEGRGQVVFARSESPDELWVMMIEKAYAKLHRSYDSLIGGYIDYGLQDLTGLVSQEIVLGKGHLGFNEGTSKLLLNNGEGSTDKKGRSLGKGFWHMLVKLHKEGSLLGCSIQPDPKKAKTGGGGVEASVGQASAF